MYKWLNSLIAVADSIRLLRGKALWTAWVSSDFSSTGFDWWLDNKVPKLPPLICWGSGRRQRKVPPLVLTPVGFLHPENQRHSLQEFLFSFLNHRIPSVKPSRRLKVEVAHPVDHVEEQEGGGEENTRVGVQLQQVYVYAAFPPGSALALLETAEEALAVFAV